MKQVKIGFDYERLHYKPGQKVSDEIAGIFPEKVKDVPVKEESAEIVVDVEVEEIKEEPVVEEVIEEKPKKKKSKKSKKR